MCISRVKEMEMLRSGYEMTKRQAAKFDSLCAKYGDFSVSCSGFIGNEAQIDVVISECESKSFFVDGYGRVVSEM